MNWAEVARRRNAGKMQELQRRQPAISVPYADSPWTAPGYLYLGHYYSCVPDPLYPWDPAVLRAIREHIEPNAMPIVVRSVWRYSNYHELGRIEAPMVLVHHGMARAVPDLGLFEHQSFHCDLPSTPIPHLRIPGRLWADCAPNQIWDIWANAENHPWGPDLPVPTSPSTGTTSTL